MLRHPITNCQLYETELNLKETDKKDGANDNDTKVEALLDGSGSLFASR